MQLVFRRTTKDLLRQSTRVIAQACRSPVTPFRASPALSTSVGSEARRFFSASPKSESLQVFSKEQEFSTMSTWKLGEACQQRIVQVLNENKALNVVVTDVRGKSTLTEFLVVCEGVFKLIILVNSFGCAGTGPRHMRVLAKEVVDMLRQNRKELVPPDMDIVTEGEEDSEDWIVVDAGDVFVHVFTPEGREQYSMVEKMWELGMDKLAVKLDDDDHMLGDELAQEEILEEEDGEGDVDASESSRSEKTKGMK